MFSTRRGKPQSRRNALRAVAHAADTVGLNGKGREPVGLHDLRHSFANATLTNATVPETTKLMRHANARVTLTTYAGVNEHAAGVAAAKLVAAGFGA